MKKITEYASVIFYSDAKPDGHNSFPDLVKEKIQEGFQPYGFPSVAGATQAVAKGGAEPVFCIVQGFVKYEE